MSSKTLTTLITLAAAAVVVAIVWVNLGAPIVASFGQLTGKL